MEKTQVASASEQDIRLDNLPAALSRFIGRQHEIAVVQQMLERNRLLTLAGPGGSGKTRLALRAAGEALEKYADGVWFIELAPLVESQLVPQAVAAALGIREQAGRPLVESVIDTLKARKLLLVLDNCEHLVQACAELGAAILRACPDVKILATSREPLGIPGEAVWVVPPLSLFELQAQRELMVSQESLDIYMQSEAIQLFVDRAHAAAPEFALTIENGPFVAEICRRLDGMPLAIELAAARMRTLPAKEIAERLDNGFQLLTSRLRSVPARQQTLAATLDWSYALLSEAERSLLQRLSVFAGGWTLEAAEAVGTGKGITPDAVLELQTSLVEKSLVTVDRSAGVRRYRLLETIRRYAQGKLEEAGESRVARNRHLTYFLAWTMQASPDILGSNLAETLDRFESEHDNLRAALQWGMHAEGGAVMSLRLAAACRDFWNARGYLSEGRATLSQVLKEQQAQERSLDRASALLAACGLAWAQSDFASARVLAEEAISISAELGEQAKHLLASACGDLGDLYNDLGDYEQGQAYLDRALALYQELGDSRHTAYILALLGWATMRKGEYDRAENYLAESLTMQREAGESQLLGLTRAGLGQLALRQGRYDEAQAHLKESLALREATGYQWGIASTLGLLGWLALKQRDFERMRDLFRRSIDIRLEIGQRGGIAWCLERLAEASIIEAQSLPVSYRRDLYGRAARIAGAAAALRVLLNSVIDTADLPTYERINGELRATLGDVAFDGDQVAGAAMSLTEVIELALELPDTASLRGEDALKAKFGGLTAREREAAILIARGKTNREIAVAMTVGVKTVETYVTRILNKLGFDSRMQIAVWARDSGLI